MEIRKSSSRTARVNELTFSDEACAAIQAAERVKGIEAHRHSQDCYSRDFAPVEIVKYYGVEIIPDIGEVVVTPEFDTEEEVAKAVPTPVSDAIQPAVVMQRLEELAKQRGLLDATQNAKIVAEIDEKIAALKSLMP